MKIIIVNIYNNEVNWSWELANQPSLARCYKENIKLTLAMFGPFPIQKICFILSYNVPQHHYYLSKYDLSWLLWFRLTVRSPRSGDKS